MPERKLIGLLVCALIGAFCIPGCTNRLPRTGGASVDATIFPEYQQITIPPNIAPLNFQIIHQARRFMIRFSDGKRVTFTVHSADGKVKIPASKWSHLLSSNPGNLILVDIYYQHEKQWKKFNTLTWHVAVEPIDNFLVYRLIEPGYETWNKMGLYQRNLESFREKPIMINEMSDGNCMNCHSFCRNNSETMLFHLRASHAGTIIQRNNSIIKVNTKTDSTLSGGVYPSWHPNGRYVAFSVNHIVQLFHSLPDKKIEVIDTLSDLILYDAEKNEVIANPKIATPDGLETFPAWSPDGKYLFFCSAKKSMYNQDTRICYDLLGIPFDEAKEKFGNIDTVIAASENGFSVSFPRVSPDGRYLVFCKTAYGNFTIWHDDSDLYMLDLQEKTITKPDINSLKSESYHNWSSNGRWFIFSSRRLDGLYTRLFLTYFDENGSFHKPFLLPQRDPGHNEALLKSYNVPELVTTEVRLNPRDLTRPVMAPAVNASFRRMPREEGD
jgi:hypothetical protein